MKITYQKGVEFGDETWYRVQAVKTEQGLKISQADMQVLSEQKAWRFRKGDFNGPDVNVDEAGFVSVARD